MDNPCWGHNQTVFTHTVFAGKGCIGRKRNRTKYILIFINRISLASERKAFKARISRNAAATVRQNLTFLKIQGSNGTEVASWHSPRPEKHETLQASRRVTPPFTLYNRLFDKKTMLPGYFIDLHTHSIASDGTDSPVELVRKAAAAGLAAVALTDHDSLSGLDAAEEEAARRGLRFVRGIELAVKDDDGELHLLGLWMPRPSERMSTALAAIQKNRRERNHAMLAMLSRMGMPLDMRDVQSFSRGEAVGRPHIALALREKGYVQSRQDAFRYIGFRGKAFVPRTLLSPEEGISLLHEEGAIVSLAHPCLSPWMTKERLERILAMFRAYGLRALEAYHSTHSPAHTRMCVELARKHKLLLTGGSDYHGRNKENIRLGSGFGGNVRVPLSVLEHLEAYRRERGLWV